MDLQKIKKVDGFWLGKVDYRTAWDLQNRLAVEIASDTRRELILLLEHPHVYTIGRRGGQSNLLWDQTEREQNEVDVVEVDRGGDITYHGPGQLVCYPLLRLTQPGWQGDRLPQADFVGYVRRLEQLIITILARFGIPAVQRENLTGVWVPSNFRTSATGGGAAPGKIASIGVKVDVRGITRHGFALNVQPDMKYWQGIIPCGLDDVRMVSMSELVDPAPKMEDVVRETAIAFSQIFNVSLDWKPTIEELNS